MNPRDQQFHYAVINPNGIIEGIIVWSGDEHFNLDESGFPAGCELVKVSDITDPDPNGYYYVDPGAPKDMVRVPKVKENGKTDHGPKRKSYTFDKNHAQRACCFPTRYEKVMLKVELTVQEQALAKYENRESDQLRIDSDLDWLCAAIFAKRKDKLDKSGKADVAPGQIEADQLITQLIPQESVAARALARKNNVNEYTIWQAVMKAKNNNENIDDAVNETIANEKAKG